MPSFSDTWMISQILFRAVFECLGSTDWWIKRACQLKFISLISWEQEKHCLASDNIHYTRLSLFVQIINQLRSTRMAGIRAKAEMFVENSENWFSLLERYHMRKSFSISMGFSFIYIHPKMYEMTKIHPLKVREHLRFLHWLPFITRLIILNHVTLFDSLHTLRPGFFVFLSLISVISRSPIHQPPQSNQPPTF